MADDDAARCGYDLAMAPTSNDVTARMKALAETFATEHGLDFELESLAAFERILEKHRGRADEGGLTRWGAYLGETIVRASPAVRWVDFDTAARASPSVAKLGFTFDTAALLAHGRTYWLPIAKVAKFVKTGSAESAAAFARVVLDLAKPAPAEERKPPADAVKAVKAFFARPSAATLQALHKTHGRMLREHGIAARRDAGATLEPFYAFLGDAKLAYTAAYEAWFLVQTDVVPFDPEPLLALLDGRATRRYAACLLARASLERGDGAEAMARFEGGDKVVRAATLEASGLALNSACMRYIPRPDPAPFVRLCGAGLAGSSDERTLALDSVSMLARKLDADVSLLLPALAGVLETGKPAQVEAAIDALKHQIYGVKHGRCRYDPNIARALPSIVRHTTTLPGKARPTKVQIAARSALSAYRQIGEQLTGRERKEVERALSALS